MFSTCAGNKLIHSVSVLLFRTKNLPMSVFSALVQSTAGMGRLSNWREGLQVSGVLAYRKAWSKVLITVQQAEDHNLPEYTYECQQSPYHCSSTAGSGCSKASQYLEQLWKLQGCQMYPDDTLPSVPQFRISSSPLHIIFVHKRRWIQTLLSEVLQIAAWTHLTKEKSDKLYGNSVLMFGIPLCHLH